MEAYLQPQDLEFLDQACTLFKECNSYICFEHDQFDYQHIDSENRENIRHTHETILELILKYFIHELHWDVTRILKRIKECDIDFEYNRTHISRTKARLRYTIETERCLMMDRANAAI